MDTTSHSHRPPIWQRLFFMIPIIGWMARDLMYGSSDHIWYALVTVISLWGIAILKFGVLGLYLPAVAMVPVMFVVLILISRG
ncbi:hypothetical protein ROA7450_02521 [Roseovarius albus]|uniref:Uncharacterized protein n=1 Tax=Roseovarius albus TaxID=1247867 RepID=A0A1X6ZGJ2_9RHOB|nr:hypothetical protein [Roseovarius albus]SLN50686.1 hypothetical protein ROA7450_02521 [Roseovarius albus]